MSPAPVSQMIVIQGLKVRECALLAGVGTLIRRGFVRLLTAEGSAAMAWLAYGRTAGRFVREGLPSPGGEFFGSLELVRYPMRPTDSAYWRVAATGRSAGLCGAWQRANELPLLATLCFYWSCEISSPMRYPQGA